MALNSGSQFRRSGQRDERRRRLFAEDAFGESAAGGRHRARTGDRRAAEPPLRKSAHYGDAEFMDEAPRVIDLVPRRLPVFFALLLVGVAAIAGMELLYHYSQSPKWVELTHDQVGVAAFDLDGEGSLAVWFSSTTLLMAALVSLIVYGVRRYRTDDYQGRYRIWLWAAMCWLLMSIDETASLHEGFKEMMVLVTGVRGHGDGSLWWAVPYFFLLGAVGSRLLVDMWSCRLSSATLLASAACFALAVVRQLEWIMPETGLRGVMVEEGAEMLGDWLLLLAMGLYARHVILDAEGLIPHRQPLRTTLDEEEADSDDWIALDAPHRTPGPVLRRRAAAKRTAAARTVRSDLDPQPEPEIDFQALVQPELEPEPEPEPENPVSRRLTKAEKKALKKRLLRERTARERQQKQKWAG